MHVSPIKKRFILLFTTLSLISSCKSGHESHRGRGLSLADEVKTLQAPDQPTGTEEGFQLVGPPLQKIGPIDPLHGFPMWYGDIQGNRLDLCVDGDPLCVALPPEFNANLPLRFPENYPGEGFYWMAEGRLNIGANGSMRVLFAIEAAFSLGVPMPGHRITFARTLFVGANLPNGVYRVTHPYGVHDLVIAGGRLRDVSDIGVAEETFTGVLNTSGSLLRWGSPDEPAGYFGDGAIAHSFTGSPLGTNFFRVERITTGTPTLLAESSLANISGRFARNIASVAPGPDTYALAPRVSLVADDPAKSILFAIVADGDTTTIPSTSYTPGTEIVVKGTGTVILRTALSDGTKIFPVKDYRYIIDPSAVTVDATPKPGLLPAAADITLTMQGPGSKIWYTLDGSDPLTNPKHLSFPDQPIAITENGTSLIRYIGVQLDPLTQAVTKSSIERKAYYILRTTKLTRSEVNPANELPFWIKDSTGLALVPCVDPVDPYCLPPATVGLGSVDLSLPMVYPRNFPGESFLWNATAILKPTNAGRAALVMAIEGAFSTPPVKPGERTLFGRIRARVDLNVAGRYRVVTPYSVHYYDIAASQLGPNAINYTEDITAIPNNFDAALSGRIGPFLRWPTGTGAPAGYIGDPGVPHQVTGSPYNTNYFEVALLQADQTYLPVLYTDLFSVSGKIGPTPDLDVAASPEGAFYGTSRLVTLKASDPAASISFSSDGRPWNDPLSNKSVYKLPFLVDVGSTVVQYQASTATEISAVKTSSYMIDTSLPSISLSTSPVATAAGLLSASPATITLTSGPVGRLGKIYYTVDGSSPLSSLTRRSYSAPFSIGGPAPINLQAVFIDETLNSSNLLAKTFIFSFGPPTVTAPVPLLVAGGTVAGTTLPVNLSWTRQVTSPSPIKAYNLQRRINGAAFRADTPAPGLSTSVTRALANGNSYQYQVQAVDTANVSSVFARAAAFTLSLFDDPSASIRLRGTWVRALANGFVGRSASTSVVRGSTATVSFTGTQVAWVTAKGPTMGIATVSIDGAAPVTVDLYQRTAATGVLAFVKSGLSNAPHTMLITVTGTRNPGSSANRVDIDAAGVLR